MFLTDVERFKVHDYNKDKDEVIRELIENDFTEAYYKLEMNTVDDFKCDKYLYNACDYKELFKENKDIRRYRDIYSGYLNREKMKTIYREFLSDITIKKLKIDCKTASYDDIKKAILEIDSVVDIIDNM